VGDSLPCRSIYIDVIGQYASDYTKAECGGE